MYTLKATLRHLAIVSWAVPADRIAAMLPFPLVPDTIDAAGEYALFSMAAMLDTTSREEYAQVNERAYVKKKDGTGAGAFFWKSHAKTTQADVYRWLLGIPEFNDDVDVTIRPDNHYICTFDGQVVLDMYLGSEPTRIAEPYRGEGIDVAKAWQISKNPMLGYTLDWGELCATKVWHNEILGKAKRVVDADPRFMVPAISLDPGLDAKPIFAAYQDVTPFNIELPPRPVNGWLRLLLSRLFLPSPTGLP